MREKALWRLSYETVARAQEVLSLNIKDLDVENKRARAPLGGCEDDRRARPERRPAVSA